MSLSQKDLERADSLKAAGNPDATLKDLFKGVSEIAKNLVDKVIPDDPTERADKEAKAYIAAANTASKVGYGLKRTAAPVVAIARGAVKGAFSVLKNSIFDKPSAEAASAFARARAKDEPVDVEVEEPAEHAEAPAKTEAPKED